jgi:glycosylphosphatidylinositol transamidase (GPIT) subunit GPI8
MASLRLAALVVSLAATVVGDHEDTWVVIVSGSRFWYNYRWVLPPPLFNALVQ